MSSGTESPTFAPVQEAMLEQLAAWYPHVGEKRIREIFEIMTDRFTTETLLFVTIIDLIERKLSGIHSFQTVVDHLGPRLQLSVISKSGKFKLQSHQMRDLHDVLVELQMSTRVFRRLQAYVEHEFGASFVFDHSCGSGLIPVEDIEIYLELITPEEQLRTRLDWESEVQLVVSNGELSHHRYSIWEVDALDHIWYRASRLVTDYFEPAKDLSTRFNIANNRAFAGVK